MPVLQIMLLLKYMDSWAVYAADMQKKILMVMGPVETEEQRDEMEANHKRNAIRVLSNVRRCIHECNPGSIISSADWRIDYNTGMHTCCGREETWIYGMQYLRDYTGEKVQNVTGVKINYKTMALCGRAR